MSAPVIALATDLAEEEDAAVQTAVALAAASGARLVTVHATAGGEPARERLERAAMLAARWGLDVAHEPMVHACCDDVADTLLDALRRIAPSLVVAGTHARSAFAQLLAGSVAEALARNIAVPTLIVPHGGRALADARTGALELATLVVAAGDADAARAGLAAAAWLARLAGVASIDAIVAHAGGGTSPELGPVPDGVRVTRRELHGAPEEALPALARELSASAIVMATRGHDAVIDAFAGSHTERVLRRCACPLLSVPIAWDH